MDELIAFVKARLNEDERTARQVLDAPEVERPPYPAGGDRMTGAIALGVHDHRFRPERTLREVAAKRAILAMHEGTHDCPIATLVGDPEWLYVSSEHVTEDALPPYWPCTTLRQLAAVWSDHPDWRQEWAPEVPCQGRRPLALPYGRL